MGQPAVVQYALKDRSVELREAPIPKPPKGSVLLQVAAVGICGSDVHQYLNEHTWPVNLPVIMGHEFSGIIEDVGEGVSHFAPGDRVVSETAAYICGECYYCRTGNYHLCPYRKGFGQARDGAFTRYIDVPERCLHSVPKSLPLYMASLCEPACIAYHAVAIKADISPGMSVAVLGAGSIGLLCVQMAKLRGANPIILSGLSKDRTRLKVGATFGATHIVESDNQNIRELVPQIGDGFGVDVVIDGSGRNQSLKDAIDIVRPAGQIVRYGWGPGAYNFTLDPLVHKQVRLQGVFSHNWDMWEQVMKMLARGQLDVSAMAVVRLPLERWQEGFEGMHDSRLIKAVIEPNGKLE
ncbi:MAG: zinc-binding dehydrogenase [Candidatus Omnitrophota bacterium]